MKSLPILVGVLLVATVMGADPEDPYLDMMKDQVIHCGKKNGYTEKTAKEIFLKEVAKGEADSTCLFDCIMRLGVFIKDSKINMETVTEVLKIVHADDPEELERKRKIALTCIDRTKDLEGCKMAYSYIKCFMAEA